jgi:hypothetical protein
MFLCASLSNLWQKGGIVVCLVLWKMILCAAVLWLLVRDMCALPVQLSDMQHFRGSKSMMYVMQKEMSYEML